MTVELVGETEEVPGAPKLRDGWRGLLDLGEKWTPAETDLWDAQWGELPVGDPLVYGCEVSRPDGEDRRVVIRLLVVDLVRASMRTGASFTLRDGNTARAVGTLL